MTKTFFTLSSKIYMTKTCFTLNSIKSFAVKKKWYASFCNIVTIIVYTLVKFSL